jgi:hypothetical protein
MSEVICVNLAGFSYLHNLPPRVVCIPVPVFDDTVLLHTSPLPDETKWPLFDVVTGSRQIAVSRADRKPFRLGSYTDKFIMALGEEAVTQLVIQEDVVGDCKECEEPGEGVPPDYWQLVQDAEGQPTVTRPDFHSFFWRKVAEEAKRWLPH